MAGRKKTTELPNELVNEILTRVPVKALVRFKCVCKRWKLLLRSKNFIKKQMTYAPRKLLAIEDNGESPPRSILYEHENNGNPKMTLEEADLTRGSKHLVDLEVIGHCDGLFCLRLQDRTLAVWNPLLKQVRTLSSKSAKPITSHDLIGFGYDHSTDDDYKVVFFSALSETIMAPKDWSRGEIVTVKSSSRRSIDEFPEIRRCFDIKGTFAGDKIFWQVNNDPENAVESETILSFDLSSEKFEYISFPRNLKGFIQGLVAVGGCLGFVETYMFQYTSKLVAWTARNDKSWGKFCVVEDCYFDGFIGSHRNDVALLRTYKNKNAWNVTYLGHAAMRIYTYNLEQREFFEVETNFISCYLTLYDYVETLLSLK
ncbi:unnamed protein product [Microthlaspi erraticum]|uniref:F-box domain-containing protein n=1 Tax=Microthlaspi erraticum TaxID=1685480 RepID=A0A6D2KE73_9BRAS|nr:unnamed protein product [Microthlaspi erraticum]